LQRIIQGINDITTLITAYIFSLLLFVVNNSNYFVSDSVFHNINTRRRGTNWGSFREGLREKLERSPELNVKDEAGLWLAVHWIRQALISAYEGNCPLRPVKKGRKSLRWTSELQSLRREVRWLFKKWQADNNPHNWELYREARWKYRKEV
jgi:hypothetical protein